MTEPQPASTPPSDDDTPIPHTEDSGADYQALYERAIAQAQRWEGRAKEAREKVRQYEELGAAERSERDTLREQLTEASTARAQVVRRLISAEVRAAATGWAQPDDAPRFLDDLDRYLTDDGEIDTAAIQTDLDHALAERPYLAARGQRPAPDTAQGARPDAAPTLDTRIAEAERTGSWSEAVALKTQRALHPNT